MRPRRDGERILFIACLKKQQTTVRTLQFLQRLGSYYLYLPAGNTVWDLIMLPPGCRFAVLDFLRRSVNSAQVISGQAMSRSFPNCKHLSDFRKRTILHKYTQCDLLACYHPIRVFACVHCPLGTILSQQGMCLMSRLLELRVYFSSERLDGK